MRSGANPEQPPRSFDWALAATHFPGRSSNACRSRYMRLQQLRAPRPAPPSGISRAPTGIGIASTGIGRALTGIVCGEGLIDSTSGAPRLSPATAGASAGSRQERGAPRGIGLCERNPRCVRGFLHGGRGGKCSMKALEASGARGKMATGSRGDTEGCDVGEVGGASASGSGGLVGQHCEATGASRAADEWSTASTADSPAMSPAEPVCVAGSGLNTPLSAVSERPPVPPARPYNQGDADVPCDRSLCCVKGRGHSGFCRMAGSPVRHRKRSLPKDD
jgi:hypothetical protein